MKLLSRESFGKVEDAIKIDNLISSILGSYERFKTVDIDKVFKKMFPIEDHNGTYELHYVSSKMGEPEFAPEESVRRNVTYSAPLRATFRLVNKEINDVIEQEVFFGDLPFMTEQGSFIYNGNDRVVVAQIVRSPGIYFSSEMTDKGKRTYKAKIIPSRGEWIEFGIDSKDIVFAKINKGRKILITQFVKALGYGTEEEVKELFNHNQYILNTLEKDETESEDEALLEIFKKIKPSELSTSVDRARNDLNTMFFDEKKYDLDDVGRYKLNKKLSLGQRTLKKKLSRDVGNYKAGTVVDDELLSHIETNEIFVENKEGESIKVIGNAGSDEKCLTLEDMIAAINYLVSLEHGIGDEDNIDHLANRRVRLPGELLKERFQVGMARVEKFIKERMNVNQSNSDPKEAVTPHSLIHIRPLVSAFKEFLGSGQLSQYVDQVNPISELTHKRRLSALGPGGFQKDRAGVEVRDVHFSHYGRICPIETPEGFSVGLINSLSIYARINEFGFLETPYRKVKNGIATDQIDYLTADYEEKYYISQASELDEKGCIKKDSLAVRYGKEYPVVDKGEVDYVDVSTKQLVSIGASLVPSLEHDDANRAVMGANMQRQAVPTIHPEEPFVATGTEGKIAEDTKASIIAVDDGKVIDITREKLVVDYKNKGEKVYYLYRYKRTNAGTCFNHYLRINKGDSFKKGTVLADGMSSNNGELALGQNMTVAFMPWEGYNFEDAILLSERLVKEDVYTSIDISEYVTEVRETRLGVERITRKNIPNVSERSTVDLDEDGVIRLGARVGSDSILVGKVTPKSQEDTTPSEKILKAIFAEKIKDVKDNSLRMPNGEEGTVIGVIRSTKDDAELPNGVVEQIKVYIAHKSKIMTGDKMAGRHGNKGVISRILPEEDMPHLEDGTPVDMVLNPLGVPSRMNIGQIMETHLGMVAKMLGMKFETPVFDGSKPLEIQDWLKKSGLPENGKFDLYDGRTGEKFENPVTVGVMYVLKLNHMVKKKLHARATGPYSLVTQQPLGGKAQMGGQRFGEMEVWALEAHGAANTLQEMLTLKSDDVFGRTNLYEAIVKGLEFPEPNVTESFKVLLNEIRSLGLDIDAISKQGKSVLRKKKKQVNKGDN